jgi:hypothetical protein
MNRNQLFLLVAIIIVVMGCLIACLVAGIISIAVAADPNTLLNLLDLLGYDCFCVKY